MLSRAVVLSFAVASGLAVANVYYAQPLLDSMADEFGIGHAAAGVVVTVTQVGYGLGLLLIVPLGDLLDRRRLILAQSLLMAVALTVVAAASSVPVLLGAMVAVGLLAVLAQVLVAYAAMLARPHQQGLAVAAVTSGIIVGILLARSVSGSLSDWLGWRSVYLASAAATLAIGGLLFGLLPAPVVRPGRLSYWELIASVFRLYGQDPLLRSRATLALLIFAAMTMLWTPMVLPLAAPPHSLSHTQVGLFGLAGAAGALGAARAGRMVDRGQAQVATAVGLVLMLAAWLLSAKLASSLWYLVLGVVLSDFGLQSVHVANQGLIYRARPEARSRLAAAYMMCYSIGCACGAMVSTWVYARAGWSGVCWAGGTISACALLFWAATWRRAPERPGVPARAQGI